jgi:putative transposase
MMLHINRKHVQRLMRLMGIEALYPKPNLSRPAPGHETYPYLLRHVMIERPHQVWSADITDCPVPSGFLYLVAVIDWYSRFVLSWELSNTLDSRFCSDALDSAFAFGQPEIWNSDQGSQFTSASFLAPLKQRGIDISMDGRGRALDNVFIERLWRSFKYELLYPGAFSLRPRPSTSSGSLLPLLQLPAPSSGSCLSHARSDLLWPSSVAELFWTGGSAHRPRDLTPFRPGSLRPTERLVGRSYRTGLFLYMGASAPKPPPALPALPTFAEEPRSGESAAPHGSRD